MADPRAARPRPAPAPPAARFPADDAGDAPPIANGSGHPTPAAETPPSTPAAEAPPPPRPTPDAPAEETPGARLARAAGALAGHLAELLDQALPPGGEHGSARDFLRAMAEAAAGDAPPPEEPHPVDRVAAAFGLTPVELDLLTLAGLPDEHEGYAGVLRTLHPRAEPRPTAGLAAQLLCATPGERALLRGVLESGSAVRGGVLKLGDEGPFWERTLHLADALWSCLHGLDAWPAALPRAEGPVVAAGLDDWLESPDAAAARAALAAGRPWTVLVSADDEERALQRGAALVASAGRVPARFVFPASVPEGADALASVHAAARGTVPVVALSPPDGPGVHAAPLFAAHPGPVVLCARTGGARLRGPRPVLEVPAGPLTTAARGEMWRALMPELRDEAPALAARYTVEPDTARAAADDARALAALEDRPTRPGDVARGVRTRAGLALSSGVRLVRPVATWEQLVLPKERSAQLREALGRLLHQATVLDEWRFLAGRPGARGVRMLFAGASGTGKTLAAEVMAHTLGVDLLLVDVSRVVSKWIGETEKNLAEVFDAAEHAQAVLLFDEADALFGKRTEVSDAHDRYANLETAFLLTRLERFEGLAVLSTNLRQNVDPAFVRRLEFVVDFPEPGPAEREALWRCHLPAHAPLAPDLNLAELAAMYPVVGGLVRNAAVAAAFLAAAEGSPITRRHAVRAIRREYDKTGRAFPGLPSGMSAP